MNRLKFALTGCGRIAERHAKHIANFGELVAVCDVVESKAKKFADVYQVPYYTSHTFLLNNTNADVIVICTPNGLHAAQSIEALHKGFHVLVEKPMAIHSSDCLDMIAAAKSTNKKLFVVKQNRFNAPVAAVKQALSNESFGKLYSAQINCYWNRPSKYYEDGWRGTMELDGGTLFTQFSHFVDLLYWMFGDVDDVAAFTTNAAHENIIQFEDSGVVSLKMKNGMLAGIHYTVNTHQKNMEGSITVFAEKGTVKIGGQYLNTLEYQNIDGFNLDVEQQEVFANDYGFYQGSMSNHHKVYEHLINCFSSHEDFDTNAFEAFKAVEIIERIYKAAKQTS